MKILWLSISEKSASHPTSVNAFGRVIQVDVSGVLVFVCVCLICWLCLVCWSCHGLVGCVSSGCGWGCGGRAGKKKEVDEKRMSGQEKKRGRERRGQHVPFYVLVFCVHACFLVCFYVFAVFCSTGKKTNMLYESPRRKPG